MGWFGKSKDEEKKENQDGNEDSLDDFQSSLDESLREEKTQVIKSRKQDSKLKAMIRTLLNAGYSIEEVNRLLASGSQYRLQDGEILEQNAE